jgi:hypothetical protein
LPDADASNARNLRRRGRQCLGDTLTHRRVEIGPRAEENEVDQHVNGSACCDSSGHAQEAQAEW